MRGFIKILFLVFIGLFIYFVWIRKEEPVPDKLMEKTEQIKRKAEELTKGIGNWQKEKDELVKKATDEITNAAQNIDSLKRALEVAAEEKKEIIRKQIEELEEKKEGTRDQHGNHKGSK